MDRLLTSSVVFVAAAFWIDLELAVGEAKIRALQRIEVRESNALSAAINPNGTLIAVQNDDGNVRLWTLGLSEEKAALLTRLPHPVEREKSSTSRVTFAQEGKLLISVRGGDLRLWDISTGRPVLKQEFVDAGSALSIGRSGRYAAWVVDRRTVQIAEVVGTKLVKRDSFQFDNSTILSLAVAPRHKTVAAALVHREGGTVTFPIVIRRFDEPGKSEKTLPVQARSGSKLLFGNDAETLAVAGTNVQIVDVDSGRVRLKYTKHDPAQRLRVYAIAALRNGKELLTGGVDGSIHLWNIQSGKQLSRVKAAGVIRRIAVSRDGRRAVSFATTQDKGNVVQLWDISRP